MARRLFVEAHDADDVNLFAGVEKWSGRAWAGFEGSCGYGRDRITTGWLKASLRALDRKASRPFDPVPACTYSEPLAPGQVVAADIALAPRRPVSGRGNPATGRRWALALAAQPAHRTMPRIPALGEREEAAALTAIPQLPETCSFTR
jgi:uncharacterized protein